jgi:hypothetical protein
MTVTATPIFPQTLTTGTAAITNGTASSLVTLYTAGTNGSKIENISVTNTDTNPYTVQVTVTISATNYLLGSISVPASTGNTASAPGLNILANSNFLPLNKDSNGNAYLYLASGDTLKVNSTSTVTSSQQLTFIAQACDF